MKINPSKSKEGRFRLKIYWVTPLETKNFISEQLYIRVLILRSDLNWVEQVN